MCKAVEEWKKEIEEETAARVEAETISRVILSLIQKGLISFKDGAMELGISER